MTKKTALVVGGNGIIGRNMAAHLAASGQWHTLITSFRPLDYNTPAHFVQLDLQQKHAVLEKQEELAEVTHVFYAAYIEKQTLAGQTATNLALLQNLVLGLEQVSPNLEHITFIQGGKAYGAHLGLYKTPAQEQDLRHFPPNFYYSQEDFLRKASAGKKWSWTALRPDIVIGFAVGNPMNLANLLAVYATLCKELQVSFRFPGHPQAYDVLVNITDAHLLARGMEYAALQPACHGQIFNITNGDIFRWHQLWPRFADYFGLAYEAPQPFPLTEYMKDKEELWQDIVTRHHLVSHSIKELANWAFGDFIFNVRYDAFFDVNKFRRYGFQEMTLPSFDSFKATFEELKARKIIP